MILSFDTSGSVLKLALKENRSKATAVTDKPIAQYEVELGRSMAQKILAEIRDFLATQELRLTDLTALEVNPGPGSYTGLRIGLTVANTLADRLNIPINGVKSPRLPIYS